jgi:hypothetical protein
MKMGIVSLLVGLIFGLGLTLSGMTQPAKVISFLDLFGSWDPSLAFVMIGAIGVHLFAYRVVKRRTSPFLADTFMIPDKKNIDWKLLTGSALFGIGWGLGGFCPGPALTSLASLQSEVVIFVIMMALGMWAQELIFAPKEKKN